jgi:hemoglobin/transferrin/lactoferrin receptor protein
VIGAVRFDGFHMNGEGNESSGQRLSPKITIGITPFEGLTIYGTYAEGYRAPSINEAFATGQHPGGIFQFLPNTGLTPEVGHTLEAGINLARNGLFRPDDSLRFKGNVFTNDVTNYIDLTDVSGSSDCTYLFFGFPSCYQYQNIAEARIRGIELEGSYDTGKWFVNASGTVLDGKNVETGERLISVLAGQAMITAGARFFDEKLTVAPNFRWFSGGSYVDGEGDLVTYNPYGLLGLSILWQADKNTTASLVLENITNETYRPYLQDRNAPGFTIKGGLKVKLASQ